MLLRRGQAAKCMQVDLNTFKVASEFQYLQSEIQQLHESLTFPPRTEGQELNQGG